MPIKSHIVRNGDILYDIYSPDPRLRNPWPAIGRLRAALHEVLPFAPGAENLIGHMILDLLDHLPSQDDPIPPGK
jgi:hypothetical protein